MDQITNENHQSDKAHQKLSINPRHMDFPFGSLKELKFFDNNIYKSAFMGGLSGAFPVGEKEFVDSVRNYRDKVTNPDLIKQVKGFIGQEGHHSHQHRTVNKELDRLGYNSGKVEKQLLNTIKKKLATMDNKFRLAHTVCAEHVTAIMGEYVINYPEFLENIEQPFADLMFWHAVEEVEHKAVAFDVFMECEDDAAYLRKTMKIAILLLHFRLTRHMFTMAFSTKHWWNMRDLFGCIKWMFGKKGMWRALRKPYKEFFDPDFHPWKAGGLELIEKWENEYYHPEQNKASDEYLQAHPV